MRFYLFAALLCSVTLAAADAPRLDAVLARSKLNPTSATPSLELTLTNRGEVPVALVLPGDGSECGWRTPFLNFTWLQDGKPVPPRGLCRCGNMNALQAGEVFTLKPGESKVITDWLAAVPPGVGAYQLKVSYTNKPDAEFLGLAVEHDEAEIQKLRASTPVSVESNAIDITIAEPVLTKTR